jgi:hypothetical protein
MGKESRLRSLDFKNTNHINGDQKSNQKSFWSPGPGWSKYWSLTLSFNFDKLQSNFYVQDSRINKTAVVQLTRDQLDHMCM